MSYKKEEKKQKGLPKLTVSGGVSVVGKETKNGNIRYFSSLSKKNDDGEWTNMFFNVRFTTKNNPEETGVLPIIVNDGFFTFTDYEGKQYLDLVVLDFDFAK